MCNDVHETTAAVARAAHVRTLFVDEVRRVPIHGDQPGLQKLGTLLGRCLVQDKHVTEGDGVMCDVIAPTCKYIVGYAHFVCHCATSAACPD